MAERSLLAFLSCLKAAFISACLDHPPNHGPQIVFIRRRQPFQLGSSALPWCASFLKRKSATFIHNTPQP
jgi:hypothetical protein